MFDTPLMRRRVRLSAIAFVLAWVPASFVLGVRWGRTLRYGGDDTHAWGPLLEGVMNFAFITAAPAALVALAVFVFHAALTERDR